MSPSIAMMGGDDHEKAEDAEEAQEVTHVVMFSGGIGSWAAAKRVAAQHGTANLVLLFTDTKMEDEDYRFLHEAAANVGAPLIIIADGRTIWDVFRDHKYLGNSGVGLCSRILKRELADRWMAEHYTPTTAIGYVGIDWSEIERFEGDSDEVIAAKVAMGDRPRLGLRRLKADMGWTFHAPMCEPPYMTKREQHEWATREGLRKQRLYVMGAAHANCFHGDTRFITNMGVKTLRQCAGQTVRVLGEHASWTSATIGRFGVQPLTELLVRRFGDTKRILTTADHRWFIRRARHHRYQRRTHELKAGDVLWSMHTRLVHNVRPSAVGIAHDRSGFGREATRLYSVALHPTGLREDFFLIEAHRAAWTAVERVRPCEVARSVGDGYGTVR